MRMRKDNPKKYYVYKALVQAVLDVDDKTYVTFITAPYEVVCGPVDSGMAQTKVLEYEIGSKNDDTVFYGITDNPFSLEGVDVYEIRVPHYSGYIHTVEVQSSEKERAVMEFSYFLTKKHTSELVLKYAEAELVRLTGSNHKVIMRAKDAPM